jgi:hypothetical protein
MNASNNTEERIRTYFRGKTAQLKALAGLAVCEHAGLIGSHREQIHRVYLQEVLPKRFAVGRGMIYGPFHRSREVDVVVWDELNYMSMPLLDHSFFFAESVRLALECKSVWTAEEMSDVMGKTQTIRDIIPMHEPTLADTVTKLAIEIEAIRSATPHSGLMITPHHIGTAAIFLKGGETFTSDFVTPEIVTRCDDAWPDVLILLGPGKLVLKKYQPDDSPGSFGGRGWLEFYDCGEDSLLAFTNLLLGLLEERSVITESPFYLMRYTPTVAKTQVTATIPFPVSRPVPERVALWR